VFLAKVDVNGFYEYRYRSGLPSLRAVQTTFLGVKPHGDKEDDGGSRSPKSDRPKGRSKGLQPMPWSGRAVGRCDGLKPLPPPHLESNWDRFFFQAFVGRDHSPGHVQRRAAWLTGGEMGLEPFPIG